MLTNGVTAKGQARLVLDDEAERVKDADEGIGNQSKVQARVERGSVGKLKRILSKVSEATPKPMNLFSAESTQSRLDSGTRL